MSRYKNLELEDKVRSHRRDLWMLAILIAVIWVTLQVHEDKFDRLNSRVREVEQRSYRVEPVTPKTPRATRPKETKEEVNNGNES